MKSIQPVRPLLPLVPLTALLLVTMGVGPCGSAPLGRVDGGATEGGAKDGGFDTAPPMCFDGNGKVVPCDGGSTDVGSVCFDSNGKVVGCPLPDGGFIDAAGICFDNAGNVIPCPGTDGGGVDQIPVCFDSLGAVIPCGVYTCAYNGQGYQAGASFPASNGCDTCTCGAKGDITCTMRACPDAGTDGPAICNYGGKPYSIGATFPATDGCNTCGCTASGIACTKIACISDGGTPVGACKVGQDQTCNEDPTISSLRGKCQADGSCLCGSGSAVSPYTGRCLGPDDTTGNGCEYFGKLQPVGASFTCSDGCSTCTCVSQGKVATSAGNCTDAGTAPVCHLDSIYVYGNIGGLVSYQDQATIAPSTASPTAATTYTLNRMVAGASMGPSCSPALPTCGDPAAIDVSDIMADILDGTVQKYLTVSGTTPMLFGIDTRPVDGPIFSFQRGDGHAFLVGAPCNGATKCTDIPAAISKLVADLRALDVQQLRSPSCAALSPSPTFKCGSTVCKSTVEYCARGTVNGAEQVATCRPYPTGCTTCDCARKDAVSTLQQVSICGSTGYTCSDGSPVAVPGSSSSPTLQVSCMVAS